MAKCNGRCVGSDGNCGVTDNTESHGCVCTLPKGHSGDHVICSFEGIGSSDHNHHTWPQEGSPEIPEKLRTYGVWKEDVNYDLLLLLEGV